MEEEKKVYTLYQLNRSIKHALETKAGENGFWVKAEIANITSSKVGHVYLDFVEEQNGVRRAAIRGVVWKSSMQSIKNSLGDDISNILKVGSEIVFLCRVTFHEVFGLSLSISEIDLSFMLGDLERRKKATIDKIIKEGIDRLNKAKTHPTVIHNIALVGSPGTAGFRDFAYHILHDEWMFRFNIEVFSASVQGKDAATQISKAIKLADSTNPDVIVLVRGGGSPLDLDCFNDFNLAVEIGNCKSAVLTGIGHETDLCVADIVSHKYFKTPTDVGDYIVDIASNFSSLLVEIATKVGSRSQSVLFKERNFLNKAKLNIREFSFNLINDKKNEIGQIKIDFKRELNRVLEKQKDAFANIQNTLNILHPKNTLKRGYSIVRKDGKALSTVSSISISENVDIEMKDGTFVATINVIRTNE